MLVLNWAVIRKWTCPCDQTVSIVLAGSRYDAVCTVVVFVSFQSRVLILSAAPWYYTYCTIAHAQRASARDDLYLQLQKPQVDSWSNWPISIVHVSGACMRICSFVGGAERMIQWLGLHSYKFGDILRSQCSIVFSLRLVQYVCEHLIGKLRKNGSDW